MAFLLRYDVLLEFYYTGNESRKDSSPGPALYSHQCKKTGGLLKPPIRKQKRTFLIFSGFSGVPLNEVVPVAPFLKRDISSWPGKKAPLPPHEYRGLRGNEGSRGEPER